jgi:hypothetical protein
MSTRFRGPRLSGAWRTAVTTALIVAVGFSSPGCVASKKYKMVKKDAARPAAELKWTAGTETAALRLQTVIVFKGPGSWKREARWDEYGVQVTNHGTAPLVIEEAALIDLLAQPQAPGDDPWLLEKRSRTNWDKYGKTGLKLLAGAGAVALYGAALTASAVGSILGGGAAAGGGAAVLSIIPVVAVVDIVVVAVINNDNKKKVVAEFSRRRLVLPLTVQPGESVAGSLFFPMTPGPQKLIVRGQQAGQPVELALELKPLAGLHLKPNQATPTSP